MFIIPRPAHSRNFRLVDLSSALQHLARPRGSAYAGLCLFPDGKDRSPPAVTYTRSINRQSLRARTYSSVPSVDPESATKEELLQAAAEAGVSGRSSMTKRQLVDALSR